MGTRNYMLDTRDLADAGRRALVPAASRGEIGYATAATVCEARSAWKTANGRLATEGRC
jgi:hypothetical protein